ncbi:MAG: hypothetical protein ACFFCS_28705 [Candidatus Hodarchaeota archaeon]
MLLLGVMVSCTILPLYRAYDLNKTKIRYDKKVLTFYYPWWGNTTDYTNASLGIEDPFGWTAWNSGYENPTIDNNPSKDTPLYGLYDCSDPDLITYHFDLAEQAMIDAFICSWWGIGSNTDVNLRNILKMAENTSTPLEFCIYYETIKFASTSYSVTEKIEIITEEVKYVLENYGDNPYYFKVDGKPVIFFYACANFAPETWKKISTSIKAEYNCFLIAETPSLPEIQTEYLSCFDGVHIYNPTYIIDQQRLLSMDKSTLGDVGTTYQAMIQVAHGYGKLCALPTIPGYDDRIIREPGIEINRNGGDTYDYLWEKCMDADWVLITSFNEWFEGTEIEPSEEYQDYYMNRTRDWALEFKT